MNETLPVSVLTDWTSENAASADRLYREALALRRGKIVVLDDDPTGVQTVHGVPVYTHWDQASIDAALAEAGALVFILTNSRAMGEAESAAVHRNIALRLLDASRRTGVSFTLISRSDSTLRGHFPLETETLRQTMEQNSDLRFDGEILCPFFREGGRVTLGNVHYVREGERLTPAAQTEFARDATFGYSHSDLRAWCAEKTKGKYTAESVTCIALDTLRACDVQTVAAQLMAVQGFGKVVVNAVAYEDVKVFLAGYLKVAAAGKRFLFRTAAAVPKLLGGIEDRSLLTRADFGPRAKVGGLVIVGSHVQKTTRQLEALLARFPSLDAVCFDVLAALAPGGLPHETARVAGLAQAIMRLGRTVVVYTSRTLLQVEGDREEKLRLSVAISDALTAVVSSLSVQPDFIIAKGGITSSDVGVKALGVRRALVMGQIALGVPVWQTDEGSRFPLMPYVIFPGNVGDDNTLADVVAKLQGE